VWVLGVFFGGFRGRFGCLIGFFIVLWGDSFVSWVFDGVCWGLLMFLGFMWVLNVVSL
jgi:hypothetical protein